MEAPQDATETFRRNFRLLLEYTGDRPMDVARKIMISPSGIGKLLRGEQSPTLRTVSLLASAYDMPPHWLCSPHFNPAASPAIVLEMDEATASILPNSSKARDLIQYAEFIARK